MAQENAFSLFTAIRAACPPQVWSQGAKLARDGLVEGINEDENEIVLRVAVSGFVVDPTVVLYTEDEDWECDCPSKSDNCAHVAAAAIAIKKAREGGLRLPVGTVKKSVLEYRFVRARGGLSLKRVIITPNGEEHPLLSSLMSSVSDRSFPHGFRPSQNDLAVDRVVGRAINPRALLDPRQTSLIFEKLSSDAVVRLDDDSVRVSAEPLRPRVIVEDGPDGGVLLRIQPERGVTEVISEGLVRCDDLLCGIAELELCGSRLEKLPAELSFDRLQLAVLTTEVIPDFERRVEVEIRTKRLPETSHVMRPRIKMEMEQRGEVLSVLPQLVYGSLPSVRMDNGKMVYLDGDIPVRDKSEERRILNDLRDELNLVTGRRVEYRSGDAARFIEKVRVWGKDALDSRHQTMANAPPLVPMVHMDNDLFRISFALDGSSKDEESISAPRFADSGSVLSAWREGLNMVPLLGGGWAPIPTKWLNLHGALVSDILAARRDDERVPPGAVPVLVELSEALHMPRQPCFDRLAPLIEGFESIPKVPLPSDLTAELREYQQEGVDWLHFLKGAGLGGILADDMGLGKTVQALCAMSGRTLVVSPTSVLHNWDNEISKFRPGLKTSIYHGPKRKMDPEADVVLTTYSILRLDLPSLIGERWDAVVLDEAQNIKNHNSQVARAAFALEGDFLLALSGTPVENRLEELWSLFHFCNRGVLGSRASFIKRYSDPIGVGDRNAAERLRSRIRPFICRRLKQEVAKELPPRTDQVLYCELEERERQVYDALRAATNKEIVSKLGKGLGVMAALEALLRLRQASCHTGLIPGQEAETSSKVELLVEQLQSTYDNGHKALVFSQWTSLLDRIEPRLASIGLPFFRLDGSTKDRASVVSGFQDENGPPVLLISLKAGGTGLNLTAADHVFIMDPWWNPAVEDQAADRAHRIGQDKPVMVYRLVAEDTVEERILELQKSKRRLADTVLAGAEKAHALTKDDLMALLEA